MAFLPGYSKYADLTVNGATIGLSAAASGWQTVAIPAGLLAVCQADLRDLRITDGTDGTTLVDYAIESIASGIVWVRPAAWSSGLTPLRAYGGHATAVDAQNWPAVTSGWAGVWPLNDAGPDTALDVTVNANNGTQSGGVTFGAVGRVDGACSFSGAQHIACGSGATLSPTTALTLSAWVKIAANVRYAGIAGKNYGAANQGYILMHHFNADGRFGGWVGIGGVAKFAYANTVAVLGQWYHVTLVYDGSEVRLYIDGAWEDRQSDAASGAVSTTTNEFNIGRYQSGSFYQLNGSVDQVSVSTSAASADHVRLLATYPGHASQSWGAVQDVPGGGSLIHYIRRLMSGGMVRC